MLIRIDHIYVKFEVKVIHSQSSRSCDEKYVLYDVLNFCCFRVLYARMFGATSRDGFLLANSIFCCNVFADTTQTAARLRRHTSNNGRDVKFNLLQHKSFQRCVSRTCYTVLTSFEHT